MALVSQAFDADPAELLTRRQHENEPRSAAIYLARLVTDAARVALGRYFGGVSAAAISKTVARVEHRCRKGPAWEQRLVTLRRHITTRADPSQKLNVKT